MSGKWRDESVKTPLGPIAYSVVGSDGEPVVLLHSLGLDRDSWHPTAQELASDATVYAVDLPGHGDSPGPRQLLTIEDYARVVDDFCSALGLSGVHLVGNSFGSIVAAEVAVSFPERVASVVLVGCPAWQSRSVREEWLHQRSGVLLTPDGGACRVDWKLVESMFPAVEDAYVDVVARGFEKAGTWIRNVMWALYAYDSTPTFARVRHRTTVVYGEHDWLQSTAPHLMSLLHNAIQVGVEGGAHMTPVNRPRELAAAIGEHLRSAAGASLHAGSRRA